MTSTTIRQSRWAGLLVASTGIFLAVMAGSLTSVALPTIGHDLHASPTGLEWTVDAYILVYAGLLVPGGVIGDRWGRRKAFILGFVIYGVGSLVAGLAPSMPLLLTARVIQGIGPALMVPASLNIVRSLYDDPQERARALGLWSLASGIGMAAGPLLGGVLIDLGGWRWGFLFNIPVVVISVSLAFLVIPRSHGAYDGGRFDYLGAILSVLIVGGLTFAIIESQNLGWTAPPVYGSLLLSVVALVWFIVWERGRTHPLIDLSLFRVPSFVAGNVSGLVMFFAFIGSIVYFSIFFQQVQGASAIESGLYVAPLGAAFAVAAPISGRLVALIGPERPLVIGMGLTGVAMFGLLRLEPGTGYGAIWWNFVLVGIGFGLAITPMTAIAVGSVPAEKAGTAGAILNALRQAGQVMGVAILGAIAYSGLHGQDVSRGLGPGQRELFVEGLHGAAIVSGISLLVATIGSAILFRIEARQRRRSESP